jgi:hypothetical protein
MNVTNDVVSPLPASPMSPDFEFSLPAATPIEKARGRRASNEPTVQAPISAADALALCMKDSAIGG